MDSCSSSPSHAFKDRPRSRLDDLSRQPSRPRCFDSAKSPAPSPDFKDKPDLSRNLIRRSYGSCSSEKEAGDDLLESSDRGRSSLRRSFGFERSERHHDFETERYRSARSGGDGGGGSRTPSRNLDRESLERSFSGRSSHGGDPHRHDVFEGVSSSPRRDERSYGACKPAPRKGSGFDKERRDGGDFRRGSSSPERDGDACKNPSSGNGFGFTRREFSNFSPRRYGVSDRDGAIRASPRKDFGLEKDCTRSPRSSPMERDGTEKHRLSSPRKAFGREREVRVLDDIDVTSPKLKFRSIKDEEKHKEHGASSGETSSRSWNKSFSSRSHGGGEDAIEEEHWSESHKDVWSERSPAMTFFHISKRVRSDRDRGRREELASKATQQHVYGNELEKAHRHKAHSVEKLDFDVAVKKEAAVNEGDVEGESMDEANGDADSSPRNVDVVVVQPNERPYGKLQIRYSVSNRGDNKSDMEEGELEPESYVMEKHNELDTTNYAELKVVDIEEGEEDDIQNYAAVPIHAKKDEEAQEGMLRVVTEVKSELNGNWDKSHEGQDEINKRCDREDSKKPLSDRKEEQVVITAGKDMADLQLQCRSMPPSTTKFMEVGESSKGGLTLDLLDERTKSWNLNPTDKGHYLSRELTLSLFTKPVEVKGQDESSESKGHTLGSQSKSNEQNGNQIERVNDSEIRMTGQHMGGASEESSQHSGHRQKKLKLESLQLSLALPGTSATVAGSNPSCLAGPREPERSFQSLTHTQTQTQNFSQSQTHTNSDGFTTSFPFSQSQSFIHNPSCSLNCTSLENQELSCGGSRQISQGTEQMSHRSWPALIGNEKMSNGMHTVTSLSQDKSKHRRGIPLYQRILQNGNMHQGFPSVTGSNRSTGSNHVSQRSHQFGQRFQAAPKILDSSLQDLEGSGRQATAHKDLMEKVRQQKAWLESKLRAMSGETHSEPNALQGRERLGDLPACNAKRQSSVVNDAVIGERNILSEKIGLHEISTEPVAVMAQKLQELPDSFLEGLRGLAKEMLGSFEKREEFITLQENIQRRMDLTEDTLLRAHRTQLEILVALRTGMQAFVQEGSKPQTYKALIDIFLQTRCRNIACQQSLPVCGCECRICSKKSGFCHQCMCVVCFKFDSDNNTCRWVVCDLCIHRCHTDCASRMSYIVPTPSIQDATGTTEMQYHCVACDHNSELFGFVKEVFHKFAEVWGAETLAKELDFVLRLFHGSEDMRGKQLCWKAKQMLQKLENKVDAAEVCRSMLRFFNEGNAELDGVCTGPKKKPSSFKSNDVSNHMADAARETMPKASSSGGNKLVDLDKTHVVPQNLEEKRTEAAKLQYDRARKRAEIEDIESIARIKQAEAKMFQVRGDEARQEASGLQRIISVKREKIDEDYDCKYAKLRLSEAEERQRKRFEELQALESAQHDYQKMKIRMDSEIKELLMKMEIAKQQFT